MLINNITGNKKIDTGINTGIIILGAGALLLGAHKIYKDVELAYKQGQYNKEKTYNGERVDIGGIAAQIYDAFYNAYWLSFIQGLEDTDTAIKLLQSVPPDAVPDIAQAYFNLFGKIMKADYIRFLSANDYANIQYLFA